jgi:hypothetical protein
MADADQLFAVMFEELPCAFLTENQCPQSLHKRPSNAGRELRPKARAQLTLEGVSSTPMLGRHWYRLAPWHTCPSAAPRITYPRWQAVPTARLPSSATRISDVMAS